MTCKDSTSDRNVKGAMEVDATTSKKKLYKNLNTMNLHFHMHLDILKKNEKKNEII